MSNGPLDRFRQLLAAHWTPLFALAAGIPALLNAAQPFIKMLPGLPEWAARYGPLALFVCLFLAVRFPRVAVGVTRFLLPPDRSAAGIADKDRVFIGPRSYTADDRERFFGRKREADDCWREIQARAFFILEGESGCGKSSLLNAGVLPQSGDRFRVVVCRIADDPFGKVHAALLGVPYRRPDTPVSEAELAAALAAPDKPLLLCLDQFEELFVTVRDEVRRSFLAFLRAVVDEGKLRLVLSLRSDFMDLLMRLCREVDPEQRALDLGSYYTLSAFRREQAEAVLTAMLQPLEAASDPIRRQEREDFVRALVTSLLRPPRDKRLSPDDEKTVLPVELQTVGMMLESLGVSDFSSERLRRLGGKTGLLQAYVEEAKTYVFRKTGVPPEQSLLILRHLISPAQTKWAQTAKAISGARSLPPGQVEAVLNAFGDKYLVNRAPREPDAEDDSPFQYEFLHEHLVQILREAPDAVLQKARDAEESLLFWKERTEPVFTPSRQRCGFRAWVSSFFAQPIPFLETLRLWRCAMDSQARAMLRRNLAGFTRRAAVVVLAVALLCGGWFVTVRGDAFQIAMLVRDAPAEAVSEPETINNWLLALIEAGRVGEAERVARSTQEGEKKAIALAEVAAALAKAGDVSEAERIALEAERVARSDQEGENEESTLVKVAVALAEAGNVPEAERVARSIQDSIGYYQASALAEVAVALAKAGNVPEAERVALEAERVARSGQVPENKILVLLEVAVALAKAGNLPEAERVALEAERVARSGQEPDRQASALAEVAVALAKAGNVSEAERVALEAERVARSGQGLLDRPSSATLMDVATVLAKVGNMAEAERVARSIQEAESKESALLEVAVALAKAGNVPEAERVARSFQEPDRQASALADVAAVLAKVGNVSAAERVALEAERVARSGQGLLDRPSSATLMDVAVALAKAGNVSEAERVALEAERVARSIQEPRRQASALTSVAVALAKANQPQQAERSARRLLLARPSRDYNMQSALLAAVAKMYAVAGLFRQAREICTYSGSLLFRDPNPPCTPEDRLGAYTFILRRYTRVTNPKAVLKDDEPEDED